MKRNDYSDARRWGSAVIVGHISGIARAINRGDRNSIDFGIDFIEQDRGFPFGALLKCDIAKALRRCPSLTEAQIQRIRERVVGMLETGTVPREYREYSKLLRKVGIGPNWSRIEAATPRNRFAQRAKAYFLNHCRVDSDDRI